MENCSGDPECVPANKALLEYAEAENDPSTFSIALHSSPWRFYDGSMRIVTPEELVETIRPQL